MSQHELSEEQARGIAAKVYEDDPAFPFHALPKPSQMNLVRYVRAGYAAANLAEAERKGAREVAEWVLDYWQKNLTVHGSGYGADRNADGGQVGVFTRKLRSYLAADALAGEATPFAWHVPVEVWREAEDRVTKHYDSVVLKREREAASTAWDAARDMWIARDTHIEFKGLAELKRKEFNEARDRYLAREYPAPAPRECVHDLKAHPVPFAAVLDGRKTFEWRKDDRGYAEGDTLLLREWEPSTMEYTGREVRRTISYILRAGFGVPDGYAVLAFAERAK